MSLPCSDPEVCEVLLRAGPRATPGRPPDLLLEVPHGATRTAEYLALRRRMRGALPEGLEDFFHVNTDAGAPELALAIAGAFVARCPERSALILRSRIPRTLTDCNRRLTEVPAGMTPGLAPYVHDPEDRALLLALHERWVEQARAAFTLVCEAGGLALMTHTYAPRSVDVVVDEHIVTALRGAWAPERATTWPLRPEADFITNGLDGQPVVDPGLAQAAAQALQSAGIAAQVGATYPLHPATLSFEWAIRWPQQVLCLELRRDLLATRWAPFEQMVICPRRTAQAATPLAALFAERLRTGLGSSSNPDG